MASVAPSRRTGALDAALAGLQAGLIAALVFLLWLGVSSLPEFRSIWTAERLMASVFYGADAIRGGPDSAAFAGLAVYLLVYSLLGAGFAALVREKLPPFRLTLLAVAFGLVWYYLFFRVAARYAAPWVSRLHDPGPTLWGHAIYGLMLARYRLYLPRSVAAQPPPAPPVVENPPATAPEETVLRPDSDA